MTPTMIPESDAMRRGSPRETSNDVVSVTKPMSTTPGLRIRNGMAAAPNAGP